MVSPVSANARRVLFGLQFPASNYTSAAWDIFDRTIFWATSTNRPPVVNAGSDQPAYEGTNLSLQGLAVDDGLPSALSIGWSKVSGPAVGEVTWVGSQSSAATTVSFTKTGVYVLRLTASDGLTTVTDDTQITVHLPGANAPPSVSAGPDKFGVLGSSVALSGAVSDDGLPIGSVLSTLWSKVLGPGTAVFGSATPATPVTLSAAGTYVLRLTASEAAV